MARELLSVVESPLRIIVSLARARIRAENQFNRRIEYRGDLPCVDFPPTHKSVDVGNSPLHISVSPRGIPYVGKSTLHIKV